MSCCRVKKEDTVNTSVPSKPANDKRVHHNPDLGPPTPATQPNRSPQKVTAPTATHQEEHRDSLQSNETEDDIDDSDVLTKPIPKSVTIRGRRVSVSAESMSPSKTEPFVPIVIPKSEEQKERINVTIAKNILFRGCDEDQMHNVVDAMMEKKVGLGEEIITQGAVGDYFYVIENGTFDVFVNGNKVHTYNNEGCFGELALMYNSPRAATITSTSEATVWALDRVTFRRILMENTNRKRRMYESFLEELKLLSSLEPYERAKIADALESRTYTDGEVVIQQGDVGDQFYIIESGEASVSKTEDGVEKTFPGLKKGDYFGELALLTDKPRQATVKANGKLKVATLGKAAFVRLLGPVVDILKRNTENYAQIQASIH
ncbi:hypothetical protein HDU79_007186 [Rhizoclosmatium sp. JEL0117]|nr:hypothetical protein HDU79_007186 [Rhizoclosmatium sp. JEL0117]